MEIKDAAGYGKEAWNSFVNTHYPPIGSFMQALEVG